MGRLYANHLSLLNDSQLDTLTKLLNRKTFDDSLQRLMNRASDLSTWLAVMDIDHFKRINDGYGHLFGDEVLLLISHLLRRSFRHQDKVFRFGGEEFVVLLRDTDAQGARHAMERFREAVQNYAFPQVGQVTLSIGMTQLLLHDTASTVLGRADEAMYVAKDQGRNQVQVYDLLQASGQVHTGAALHTDVDLF